MSLQSMTLLDWHRKGAALFHVGLDLDAAMLVLSSVIQLPVMKLPCAKNPVQGGEILVSMHVHWYAAFNVTQGARPLSSKSFCRAIIRKRPQNAMKLRILL